MKRRLRAVIPDRFFPVTRNPRSYTLATRVKLYYYGGVLMRRSTVYLGIIILLAILGAFFVYPQSPVSAKWRAWRLGLDLIGGAHLVYRVDLSQVNPGDQESVINGLRDTIERRVNLFGVSEPQVFVAESGEETQLVVELAGVRDINEAIDQIGATPFLEFRVVVEQGTSTVFLPTELNGRYLESAQLDLDPTTRQPKINFSLNEAGAEIFQALTKELAPAAPGERGQPMCIFVDGEPIIPDSFPDSCPLVGQEIAGGRAEITGNFDIQRAQQIVERFNAGALPAPITLIDQLTVSPVLGADSLRNAIFAGASGTLFIILFMLVYYRTLGLFSAIALVFYIIFTLSVFKLIPITLTLAGLAGFILTIGMAVDANILIFERMKEEMRRGLSRATALNEGFRRAWPSIRDSNTSTIITALILYYFTSSFIRGFALTLLIGTLVSMFSAITTTRLLLEVFLRKAKT